jgi:Domain of unknown function (DUF4430)
MGHRARSASAVVAVAAAMATAGCGLGAGSGSSNVTVSVTRSFGTTHVAQLTQHKVPGSETVIRMLERHFPVQTRFGGGFVESIDGLSGGGSKLDWFYYVNGVQAPQGAATTAVHGGDRIWWDLHDWDATNSIPAVVGSFPEPFVHGLDGKKLPTVLECAGDVKAACTRVSKELESIGVTAAMQTLGTGSGSDSLAIEVGTWSDLNGQIVASLIDQGPAASGVYARFTGGGGALQLLDPHGHVSQTLGSGAGLVAATAEGSSSPTWLVTGTNRAGVAAAASALTPGRLHDRFALATQGGNELALPLRAGS